jgi:serine protease AprX
MLILSAFTMLVATSASQAAPDKLSKLVRDAAAGESDQTRFLNLILLPASGYSTADVVSAVQEADGKALADTLSSGAVTAQVRINKLDKINADPRVQAIIPNLPITPTDLGGVTSTVGLIPATDYAGIDNAPAAWAQGYNGAGVGIAIIDSGVSASPDFGSRLVHVSLPGQTTSTDDAYGHGSMVAGVAAGQSASGVYRGIAPGATIYALKVAKDENGVRSSDIISALDWVTLHKNSHNVRVIVLSISEVGPSSYHGSLLDAAVEHAWRNGIVVVTAAGNLGAGSQFFAPANDPFVLSVGSLQPDGVTASDFTSFGTTPDGYSRPDIYAPGRHIASTLPVGSVLASQAPLANILSPGYARASGTSLAAPQVAGAAAILLQQRPNLTPNQVKWLLMQSARSTAPGKALDVGAAVSFSGSVENANQGIPVGNCKRGTGWSGPCSAPGDAYFQFFDWTLAETSNEMALTAAASWNGATWNGATWNGATWNGATWNGATWNGATWNGATWNGATWN